MLAFKEQGYSSSYDPALSAQDEDANAEIHQIGYENEDPAIAEEYYRELESKGITLRLPPSNQGSA